VRNALDVLESEAGALARDARTQLTIGPIAIAVALSYIDFRFAALGWREGHDQLANWYAEYSQRPAMRETAFVDQ